MKKKDKILEDSPHLKHSTGKTKRENVHSRRSKLKGFAGLLETLIRNFRGVTFSALMFPIGLIYIVCIAASLTPGYILTTSVYNFSLDFSLPAKGFCMSLAIAISYFIYGICIVFIVPFFNKILFLKMKPWRGSWYSLAALPWYYHNALTQLVRYTFLDLVTPTPINVLFYKMMGMKIGKGVMINTTNISDPGLITLDDYVTIGGSATIFAHYAQGGYLVIAPVHIKAGATVGLKASIMGDVVIGEKVTVKPHSVVLPKSRLKKGEPQ